MTGGDFVVGIGIMFLIIFMFVVGVLVGLDGRAVERLRDDPHRLPRPRYRPSAGRRFITRRLTRHLP